MKKALILAATLGAGIALSPNLFAQSDVDATSAAQMQSVDDGTFAKLGYRIWGGSRDTESFDDTRTDESREDLYHAIDTDLGIGFGSLKLRLTTQLLGGQLSGPGPDAVPEAFQTNNASNERGGFVGDSLANVADFYNGYAEYRSIFLARIGLQSSSYGLGMVANDGASDDLFNIRTGADRSLRLLIGARPFALGSGASRTAKNITFVLGGDYVYIDDNASIFEEDRAIQGVASLFYQDQNPQNPDEQRFLGLYLARRDQTDADEDRLKATAIDLHAKQGWQGDSDYWFYGLGFESALLTGETTRAFTQSGEDRTRILAFGTAVEAEARIIPMQMALKLKGGYASGDADSDDDTLFRFRFDPNYKVGLVLFDHYIPAMTRQSYFRATDPSRSGDPPKGVEGLISDGAVENAIYLNPQIQFGQKEGLLAGVGFLWARSAVPLADPFNTFANGGTPVGINGGEGSRNLGVEIDGAARYRRELVAGITGELKLEYGILFPGRAFDDQFGNSAPPQNLVRGRMELTW